MASRKASCSYSKWRTTRPSRSTKAAGGRGAGLSVPGNVAPRYRKSSLDLRKNTETIVAGRTTCIRRIGFPICSWSESKATANGSPFRPDEVERDPHGGSYGNTIRRSIICGTRKKVARGEMKVFKKIAAIALWRKMPTMLFETGHPWITSKDACNLRSPKRHVGVVHSSSKSLHGRSALNTSDDEIAVCNLGSVNLAAHAGERHARSVVASGDRPGTAMRMLDNVIDVNYYGVPRRQRRSNLRGIKIPGRSGDDGLCGHALSASRAVRGSGAAMEWV